MGSLCCREKKKMPTYVDPNEPPIIRSEDVAAVYKKYFNENAREQMRLRYRLSARGWPS